jgi:hypothetical protein
MTTPQNASSDLTAETVARVVLTLADMGWTILLPGQPLAEREPPPMDAANGHALVMQVIEVQPQPGPATMGAVQPVGVWLQQVGVPGGAPCHLWLTIAAGQPLPFRPAQTCLLTLTPHQS